MTPPDEPPEVPQADPVGRDASAPDLDAASAAMKQFAEQRALVVAPAVLAHVLAQPRRSLPVRGTGETSYLRVSEKVLASVLQQRINDEVAGAAVRRIFITVDRHDYLEEIAIHLIGQYASALPDIADRVRALAQHELSELLGTPVDNTPPVVVHLHFCDVTIGDPTLEDPDDLQHPSPHRRRTEDPLAAGPCRVTPDL